MLTNTAALALETATHMQLGVVDFAYNTRCVYHKHKRSIDNTMVVCTLGTCQVYRDRHNDTNVQLLHMYTSTAYHMQFMTTK